MANNLIVPDIIVTLVPTGVVNVTPAVPATVVTGTVTTIPPANASTNLTEVGGAAIAEGQTVMASSIPVVIASNQSAIPVTGTITTSPNVNVHDGSGNTVTSTGTSLNVDVTNTVPVTGTFFQTTQPITRVGATLNTNQISIGSTSTLILAANANRKRLVLINMGTTNVFIGNIGVTIGTGQLLLGIAGYVIPLYFTGAVYGIIGSGTQTIAYLEEAI